MAARSSNSSSRSPQANLPQPTAVVGSCEGLHKYHIYWGLT